MSGINPGILAPAAVFDLVLWSGGIAFLLCRRSSGFHLLLVFLHVLLFQDPWCRHGRNRTLAPHLAHLGDKQHCPRTYTVA